MADLMGKDQNTTDACFISTPHNCYPLSNSSLPQTSNWKIRGTQALLCCLGCSQMQLLILNCQTAYNAYVYVSGDHKTAVVTPFQESDKDVLLVCYRRYYSI